MSPAIVPPNGYGFRPLVTESALDRKFRESIFDRMNNWKQTARVVFFYSSCLAVIPVSCNSIFAKSKAGSDDGYEYVTSTGSMLPQRVKKGDTAVSNAPVGTMSGNQFDKMRQQIQLPPPKGN